MKTLALTTLSTKILMLLCVSGFGLFGTIQESKASYIENPCHKEFAQKEEKKDLCDVCDIALDAWEEDGVDNSEVKLIEVSEFTLLSSDIVENFISKSKPLEGIYHTYYPPPQVLLKAVTPNTKTIVILS